MDKTIKANKEIFPVLESDTNRLEEIFFRLKVRKILFQNPSMVVIEKIYKEFKANSKEFYIDLDEFKGYLRDYKDNHISNFTKRKSSTILANSDYTRYRYLENIIETKAIKIYEYEQFLILTNGKCFGDYALEVPNALR